MIWTEYAKSLLSNEGLNPDATRSNCDQYVFMNKQHLNRRRGLRWLETDAISYFFFKFNTPPFFIHYFLISDVNVARFIHSWASHSMTKPIKWHVRPAKTQISLGIQPVWSESSMSVWRNLGSLDTYWVHSDDFDKTARTDRLINLRWVYRSFCWFCRAAAQFFVAPALAWAA